ncbi:MAG: polysaccharide deacetylase family protein [Eubacteriales bacterium]|nr:polysaccharide deacetylase family protein [Eubacteriales bacterium]
MDELELRRLRAKRLRLKKARIRRVRILRGMCCLCGAAVIVAAAALAAGWKRTAQTAAETVLARNGASDPDLPQEVSEEPSEVQTAPAEPPKSWEGELPDVSASYGICVEGVGWSHYFADNSYCMAPAGQNITSLRAQCTGQPEDMTGTIEYQVYENGAWTEWAGTGYEAGTVEGYPLEAARFRLTGELGEHYEILYSVLQNEAWTDWIPEGDAGSPAAGVFLDGIRLSVVKKQEGQAVYAGGIDPNRPMVALTYDDGPSARATLRILARLGEYDSRATFFMVGKQAEKYPDVVEQMVAQGCEPANHTYDHTLMSKVAPEELASQLARTNQVVSDASGVSPVLMRPCGGVRSEVGMSVVGAISMPAILWSIDTLDWKTRDAQSTIDAVLSQVKDGDIVLMHDLYDTTADASDVIIPELINRGFQLVTVSELASYRGGMLPGKTYGKFRP